MHTYGSLDFFFSVQNSLELIIRFIEYCIQWSVVLYLGMPTSWDNFSGTVGMYVFQNKFRFLLFSAISTYSTTTSTTSTMPFDYCIGCPKNDTIILPKYINLPITKIKSGKWEDCLELCKLIHDQHYSANPHCFLLEHYYSVDFLRWFDRKISFFSLLSKTAYNMMIGKEKLSNDRYSKLHFMIWQKNCFC